MGKEINRWKESGLQICQAAFKGFFLSFFLDNRRNYRKVILSGSTAMWRRGGVEKLNLFFFFWKDKLKKKNHLKCIASRKGIFSFWFCKKDLSMREQVESYSESCLLVGNRAGYSWHHQDCNVDRLLKSCKYNGLKSSVTAPLLQFCNMMPIAGLIFF